MKNNSIHREYVNIPVLFACLFAVIFFLAPESAYAFDLGFTPSANDVSIKLVLSKLFGGAMPGAASGGFDPFAGMLKIINGAALSIGGILAAYTLVAGTMQTAHDGEMLGKKWSSMWLPIRTVLGVGLTVPMGSGYCVAQFIVMWLAVQGVGLADTIWQKFLTDGMSQMVAYAVSNSPQIDKFAEDALKIQTCMATVEAASSQVSSAPLFSTSITTKTAPFTTASSTGTVYGFNYATTVASILHPSHGSACGSISVPASTNTATSNPMGDPMGGGAIAAEMNNGFDATIVAPINAAHKAQADAMMIKYHDLAVKLVDPKNTTPPSAADFDAQIKTYKDAIKAAVLGVDFQAQLTTLNARAAESGWFLAGAWFARVASLLNTINTAMTAVPTASINPDTADISSGIVPSNTLMNNQKIAGNFYKTTTSSQASIASGTAGITGEADAMGAKEDTSKIAKWLMTVMTGFDVSQLKTDTRHPLIIAQEMGNRLANSLGAAVATLAVISMLTPTLGGIGALLAGILLPAIAGAMMLSVYLPLMPFILYLGAAFGWVLLVVEAMVAAPLWAIMHLSPSGDDLMGSARSGYTLLLSLMLRPALIVFGFAGAVFVSYPFGFLLNSIFFQSFLMAQSSVAGVITMIAAVVVYAGVLTSIMHKCFALIHKIPDELLKWFGGGGSSLGEAAQSMNQGARGAAAAIGQAAQQAGSNAMQTSASVGANRAASNRQLKADQMNQKNSAENAVRTDASEGLNKAGAAGMQAESAALRATSTNSPADLANSVASSRTNFDAKQNAATALEALAEQKQRNDPYGGTSEMSAASDLRQEAQTAQNEMETTTAQMAGSSQRSSQEFQALKSINDSSLTKPEAQVNASIARKSGDTLQAEAVALKDLAQTYDQKIPAEALKYQATMQQSQISMQQSKAMHQRAVDFDNF